MTVIYKGKRALFYVQGHLNTDSHVNFQLVERFVAKTWWNCKTILNRLKKPGTNNFSTKIEG